MENNKDNFKGIWIPKEVLCGKDLTLTEKCLLGQIYSLDNGQGCFASNMYLGRYFQLSPGTVDNILRSLREKGWLVNLNLKKTDSRSKILRRLRVVHRGKHFFMVDTSVKYKPIYEIQRIPLRSSRTR